MIQIPSKINDRHQTTDLGSSQNTKQRMNKNKQEQKQNKNPSQRCSDAH